VGESFDATHSCCDTGNAPTTGRGYLSTKNMDKDSPERKLLLDEYLSWQEFDGVVVLSPEWTVEVPLWPQSDAVDDLVPVLLLEKLVEWQAIFDSNYRWDDDTRPEGWVSEEAKDRWEQEAPIIVAELLSALEGKAELIVDLWPMVPREQNRELHEYWARRKAESDRWSAGLKEAGINLRWRAPTSEELRDRAISKDDKENRDL
jgi:hypothetical protein